MNGCVLLIVGRTTKTADSKLSSLEDFKRFLEQPDTELHHFPFHQGIKLILFPKG